MVTPSKPYAEVVIDLAEINDWPSFHAVFKRKMGFAELYGANMDAWIDCMTCVDMPDDGMSSVHAPPNGVLVLTLNGVGDFKKRCPHVFDVLANSAAFVNWRRLEKGDPPVLVISYNE